MNRFWIKTPFFFEYLFPKYHWKIKNTSQKIYLTFDDGPIPEVTEWVLDILKKENIKATFFCIGENITKHSDIFLRILKEGHSIGNHTFNHLNGWKTNSTAYITNTNRCHEAIKDQFKILEKVYTKPFLFRPPYGKIKNKQASELRKKGYKIVMWDVLSYDFDPNISPEKCLDHVLKNTTIGSIIVFHDSIKAKKNLEYALPKAIEKLKEKGFTFEPIH